MHHGNTNYHADVYIYQQWGPHSFPSVGGMGVGVGGEACLSLRAVVDVATATLIVVVLCKLHFAIYTVSLCHVCGLGLIKILFCSVQQLICHPSKPISSR